MAGIPNLKGGKNQPSSSAKPGSGGRFKALKKKLGRKGIRNPGALAAAIGRKKFGKKKFQSMAAHAKTAALQFNGYEEGFWNTLAATGMPQPVIEELTKQASSLVFPWIHEILTQEN